MILATQLRSSWRWAHVRAMARRFVAEPASPVPLAVFRIGLGLVVLAEAAAVLPHVWDLYGACGIVQETVVDEFTLPLVPRLSWLTRGLAAVGLGEATALKSVFAAHLFSTLALIAGWRTRLAAVGVWLTNLVLTTTAAPHLYGVDTFIRISLFYAMFAPIGAAWSFDARAGRVTAAPSFGARLAIRLLQLQLVVVYVASGIEKASGAQWWNGEAFWRAVMRSDLATADFSFLAWRPAVPTVVCLATLLLEVGYGVFVWPGRTRRLWALATIAMHAGIAVALGLWAFSAIMMLLNACAWLVPCDPRVGARVSTHRSSEAIGWG